MGLASGAVALQALGCTEYQVQVFQYQALSLIRDIMVEGLGFLLFG